jgi:glycine betaine/choline ABC-type transport system substrate-binding protein
VVKKSLLTGSNGMLLEQTVDAVSAKLTLGAMQQMNRAYYVLKAPAKQIAHGFLSVNHLLK